MAALFLLITGIPAHAQEEAWEDGWEGGIEPRQSVSETVPEPPPEVALIRQLKVEGLKWKAKYLQCLITNNEFASREAKRQLDQVNREIRALLVGAPHINEKTDDSGRPTAKE